MISRATILVRGDIQEAGYRSLVLQVAQELKLTGYVENLEDGRVRIICEGDRDSIVELCRRIRVKDEFVRVTSIRKRFNEPKGEFRGFVVKIGDLAFEMFQGYATAGKYFRSLGKKVECVGENVKDVGRKVECVGEKVECVGENVKDVGRKVECVGENVLSVGDRVESVGKGVNSMHEDMNQRFDKLDDSYDRFASKIYSLDNHIKEIRDDFRLLINHVVDRNKGLRI